jgi:hypothetical protein
MLGPFKLRQGVNSFGFASDSYYSIVQKFGLDVNNFGFAWFKAIGTSDQCCSQFNQCSVWLGEQLERSTTQASQESRDPRPVKLESEGVQLGS